MPNPNQPSPEPAAGGPEPRPVAPATVPGEGVGGTRSENVASAKDQGSAPQQQSVPKVFPQPVSNPAPSVPAQPPTNSQPIKPAFPSNPQQARPNTAPPPHPTTPPPQAKPQETPGPAVQNQSSQPILRPAVPAIQPKPQEPAKPVFQVITPKSPEAHKNIKHGQEKMPELDKASRFLTRGRVVAAIAALLLVSFYLDKFPVKAPEGNKGGKNDLAMVSGVLPNTGEATPSIGNNGASEEESVPVMKAFFNNSLKPNGMECTVVYAASRAANDPSPKAALASLLSGVTDKEGDMGYFTSISPGVPLLSVDIEDDVAIADFGSHLAYNVEPGSCRAQAIRSQISNTLLQFTGVKSVKILVDGKADNIFDR